MGAIAMGLIIFPIAFIFGSIDKCHLPFANGKITISLTLVFSLILAGELDFSNWFVVRVVDNELGAIRPNNFRFAVASISFELAL